MRSRSRITSPRLLAAIAVPLAVAVLLSIAVIIDQRDRGRLQVDSSVREIVAGAVTQVRTEIRTELSAARTPQPGQRFVPVAALPRAAVAMDTAITARDTGTAELDDTARPPSIIAPVYRTGAAPASTEQRRKNITGYRVVPLTLQSVVTAVQPDNGGITVRGPNRVVIAHPRPAPSGARSYSVLMDPSGLPGWAVEGWRPSPAIPGVAWLWTTLLFVIFGAAAAGAVALLQQTANARERQERLERDRSLITGLAPVLQASLDVGEVVPAVSSHLADGLGLDGLSLSRPGGTGERQLFAWGEPPDWSVAPTPLTPARLDPGRTFALSLARGGRVLGTLRIVAGRPLLRDDLLALTTAGELLGSTLANAEAFAQQQDLVDRMRSVDELKTVFLATASHELRTPVTALVGFSKLLLDGWDVLQPEQGRGLVERIQSNARRLEKLIEQLLDFSRLERGLPRSSNQVLDMARTVRDILTDQPEIAADHELRLDLAQGCMIRGSNAALERIVTNLVGNAAKYSPAGTVVTVRVRSAGDHVMLIVDDQGSGVPEEDRERVFSRFYRGRGDSVTRTRGAGIGLAIVAEYAASLSGSARVATAPGGGARFIVSFPALRLLATPEEHGSEREDVLEGDRGVALP